MDTRIALAACVVLGGALCGKAVADAARRRARSLAELAEGIRTLRIHMTGLHEPVRNALARSGCALLERVGEGMEGGVSAGEAWKGARSRARARGGPADALAAEELRALDGLLEGLGQSGREEQEALIAAALREIEALRDAARTRAAEADRLYVSLGLLIGLMLALIVL